MENLRLRQAAPTSVNVTVGKRSREYLTDREVERLRVRSRINSRSNSAIEARSAPFGCECVSFWNGGASHRNEGPTLSGPFLWASFGLAGKRAG